MEPGSRSCSRVPHGAIGELEHVAAAAPWLSADERYSAGAPLSSSRRRRKARDLGNHQPDIGLQLIDCARIAG